MSICMSLECSIEMLTIELFTHLVPVECLVFIEHFTIHLKRTLGGILLIHLLSIRTTVSKRIGAADSVNTEIRDFEMGTSYLNLTKYGKIKIYLEPNSTNIC